MNTEWHIEVRDRVAQFLTDIWIYRRAFGDKIVLFVPQGEMGEEKEYNAGTDAVSPSLTIPCSLKGVLLEALLSQGVKPSSQSFVEGKLQATEEHLADLRHMLKLPLEYVVVRGEKA